MFFIFFYVFREFIFFDLIYNNIILCICLLLDQSIFGYFIGPIYFYNTLYNLILVDIFANIYSFIIIVTNHAGSDLYRFDTHGTLDFRRVYRAVLGSVNYPLGNDIIDFLHGYLNYQIEHHMFPNLSCLEYKKLAPEVEKICKEYKVQYIKQNVFIRMYYTYRIFTKLDKMKLYQEPSN